MALHPLLIFLFKGTRRQVDLNELRVNLMAVDKTAWDMDKLALEQSTPVISQLARGKVC